MPKGVGCLWVAGLRTVLSRVSVVVEVAISAVVKCDGLGVVSIEGVLGMW